METAGFEVLVFHATGTGGKTMEAMIRDGLIAGVLDLTTDRAGRRLGRRNPLRRQGSTYRGGNSPECRK